MVRRAHNHHHSSSMMSHQQYIRLVKYQRGDCSESSFSSSEDVDTNNINNIFYSNQTSTTTSATSTTSDIFFNPKLTTKNSTTHQRCVDYHQEELISPSSSRFSLVSRRGLFSRLKLWCGSLSFMAGHAEMGVYEPLNISKKRLVGQQKKEDLEREVSMLHKMLNHEQKLHEFLEQVQHRKDGSCLSIPNYLPPKMKELAAELVMVEDEITRLESQISQLQTEVNHEREITKESKAKQQQQQRFLDARRVSSLPPLPKYVSRGLNEKVAPLDNRNEKVAFEPNKALHFISKAIKGDYNLSDFTISEKQLKSRAFSDQKENQFHEGIESFREKNLRKGGMLKPASPLREPRRPTPRRERNQETILDPPPKYVSTPLHSEEENIEKWPPNKLSENIMKCLIFIFVRLLRTTRAMELEKSGPILRSTNFSLSFRAETSSNPKTSLMLQKDSRQQDPYGIFDLEESIPRDVGAYKNLVRFTSSSMDPKCISSSNSIPLFQRLKLLMNRLQKVDLRFLTNQQKLAFWINIYNACIMHGFLQYGVPSDSSPEKLLTLMNKATLNVGGNTINAHTIEHFILRKPPSSLVKEVLSKSEKDNKAAIIREIYGLESSDPNVTFALCCGTRSSPAVRIYSAEGVTGELEKSKLEYLQASIIVTSSKRIALPELLLRNMHDFARDVDSLIEWVCHQLPTSGTLRKSMVDCFRGVMSGRIYTIIEKIPYDFEFQYLLAI